MSLSRKFTAGGFTVGLRIIIATSNYRGKYNIIVPTNVSLYKCTHRKYTNADSTSLESQTSLLVFSHIHTTLSGIYISHY